MFEIRNPQSEILDMAETFRLEITTAERRVLRADVEEAQIPARNGYIGVLAGHAPLLSEMEAGQVSYRGGGQTKHIAVSAGFVEVLPGQTRVLAETAEPAEEIDVARAQAARDRAEQRLRHPSPDIDLDRARTALARSLARLQAASKASR